ncbi:MAG: ThuA domain-containing protein [Pseudomonadota bacterium]
MMFRQLLPLLVLLTFSGTAFAKQFEALLFTKTAGWHHQSLAEAVPALRALADKHHFHLEWSANAEVISADNLARFDVVLFVSTTGDVLNEEQERALQAFVRSGKGFVGVHAAADTEPDWDWFGQLVGRRFVIHPEIQSARLELRSRDFPGLERMPDSFWWTDEWYEFTEAKVEGLNYLLTVDETTFDPRVDWGARGKGVGMGDFHPISWFHDFDGGRSFYTALGHTSASWSDALFMEHVYGGIYWAATGKGLRASR